MLCVVLCVGVACCAMIRVAVDLCCVLCSGLVLCFAVSVVLRVDFCVVCCAVF